MKKVLLFAMLSLVTCLNSNAQFNRIINASIGDDFAKDIISIGGGHSVILSASGGSFTRFLYIEGDRRCRDRNVA